MPNVSPGSSSDQSGSASNPWAEVHANAHYEAGVRLALSNQALDDFGSPGDNTDLDATSLAHGLMPKQDKVKLDGIETGATADQTDSEIATAYHSEVPLISQADAEAGTATAIESWSSQRVAQAITAQGGGPAGPTGPAGPVGPAQYATSVEVLNSSSGIKDFYDSVGPGSSIATSLFVAPVDVTVKKVSVSYLINDNTGSSYDEIELDFGTINLEDGTISDNGFSVNWSPESNTGISATNLTENVSQGEVFGVGFLNENQTSLAGDSYNGLVITIIFEDDV
jgi:hypothetical protein